MSFTKTKKEQGIQYSDRVKNRAARALCCSPFKLKLFMAMKKTSVALADIAATTGIEKGYTKKIVSESSAESDLMWLIQVGLLRREVDGQGITDSFRLTPLGRQLVEIWHSRGDSLPTPSWWERLLNWIDRSCRLPI